jgi:hypothetical protein
MQDGIEIEAIGEARVGIEVALRKVRARHDAEAHTRHVLPRQRFRAPDRRLLAAGLKAVVIGRGRLEPARIELHGEVAGRAGFDVAARHGVREFRIASDLPPNGFGRRRSARRDARPEDHAIRQRVAARHAVAEDRIGDL